MATTSVEEAMKHIPRAYQEELLVHAQRTNVIATLDTGSGKTFIAALLIKSTLAMSSEVGKKVVFLVPKVPLVDQQHDFLERQTPLRIRGYKGAMGVDEWDEPKWKNEFTEVDVLVMTAQIFKNILTHGYWSLEKVSLLVFDECHHCQNKHPYCAIMQEHYSSCPSSSRPKVFGMTASPVWNPKNPIQSIQTLQRNLFSKVMAVRQHEGELLRHSHKPIEVVMHYPRECQEYPTYRSPSLWDQVQEDGLSEMLNLRVDALRARYLTAMHATGPFGADYFLSQILKGKVKEYIQREYELSLKSPRRSVNANSPEGLAVVTGVDTGTQWNIQKLERLQSALATFDLQLSSSDEIPLTWLSPKMRTVVAILEKHRSELFQGIVFVEQRHVASILSWILPRLAGTKGWMKCAELTGHGGTDNNEGLHGMNLRTQRNVVERFKSQKLNLLIATSVAEEGLDFPACDLVIRFDPIQHMIGYVQSRGRARHQASTFIVMIEENDATALSRYQAFRSAEPELRNVYQSFNEPKEPAQDDQLSDHDDPQDLQEEETYVVPTTGAMLTYSSSIALLEHLCSLIPRDAYTIPLSPKYVGDFQVTLHLPVALPLPKHQLIFKGPLKLSKKEARRSVAFLAVKRLHELGVFDDHLSPVTATKGDYLEDADGHAIAKVNEVSEMMDVEVVSPWKAGPPWYLHVIARDGRVCAGLVSGSLLPGVDVQISDAKIQLSYPGSPIVIEPRHAVIMEEFMKTGLWWCVTASPITAGFACFLVPLNSDNKPDWISMEKTCENRFGTHDWASITKLDEGGLLVMDRGRYGRPLRLVCFRSDLPLDGKPVACDEGQNHATYMELFNQIQSARLKHSMPGATMMPIEGPILEVLPFPRRSSAVYSRRGHVLKDDSREQMISSFYLPQSWCKWVRLSMDMVEMFRVLSPLCSRIVDVYRARTARFCLELPHVSDDLICEALTLPIAKASFDNQRLETLGDSVLKLSVVVYLFNRFPHKHEGQLTKLKSNSVSNRLLLARAKQKVLEQYITSEPRVTRTWKFVIADAADSGETLPKVFRNFPRRSLQDCMEALLGASYLAGGIDIALETGTALDLCFGGSAPWTRRYNTTESTLVPTLFASLEDSLGYKFRDGRILVEAVTHSSFELAGSSCYQRLEFLGDAVIELVVMTYLFRKFPDANSGQLSSARSRAVCGSTIAAVGVRRLSLHKYLLANNVELGKEILQEIGPLTSTAYEDIVVNDWKYNPPKVLADIFESVLGAVFVDSGFDYDATSKVIERVMDDVLNILHPDIPRDPVSRFLIWAAKSGCRMIRFERVRSNELVQRKDSVIVLVHDKIIVGPIVAENLSLAKGLAAEDAQSILSDEFSDFALSRICDCMVEDEPDALSPREMQHTNIDEETVEGFALAGKLRLDEVTRDAQPEIGVEADDEEEIDEIEIDEVELLLHSPSQLSSNLGDSSDMDDS